MLYQRHATSLVTLGVIESPVSELLVMYAELTLRACLTSIQALVHGVISTLIKGSLTPLIKTGDQ